MKRKPSVPEMLFSGVQLGAKNLNSTDRDISCAYDWIVTKKNWVIPSEWEHLEKHLRLYPGAASQKLLAGIGERFYGKKGGLLLAASWALSPAIVWFVLVLLAVGYGTHPWAVAFLGGVKPAVAAIWLVIASEFVRPVLPGKRHLIEIIVSSAFFYGCFHLLGNLVRGENSWLVLVIFFMIAIYYIFPPVLMLLLLKGREAKLCSRAGNIMAGVSWALVIFYGQTIVWPEGLHKGIVDFPALLWGGVSFWVLTRHGLGFIPLILVSGTGGIVYFLINSGL